MRRWITAGGTARKAMAGFAPEATTKTSRVMIWTAFPPVLGVVFGHAEAVWAIAS
jgi:hypothetical protein